MKILVYIQQHQGNISSISLEALKGAQEIENRGFFIGIHVNKITERQLKLLENKLLKIDEI